nr:esterase 3 [Geocoris pallidipennis]
MISRLLVVLLLVFESHGLEEDPEVDTPLGKLSGHWLESRSGRRYMAFSGIPYAKPPVGKLRFQPPEAVGKWKGVRDAKKNGPYCLQYDSFLPRKNPVLGEEDCLYLNVYTHNISRRAPVLVFIHGGAFFMGNGDMVKPTFLMDEEVVIVNVNYRLGIMGFLSFETKEMPGNMGLKDQSMALRWVKENIGSFGGDPDKVTILGPSAGGASIYHHFISPLSKGLFHRGLSSSGSSYNPWALSPPGLARSNAEKLMALIGCPTEPKEAMPCLMDKDPKEVVKHFPKFFVFQNMDPMLSFSPVMEKPAPGAFIVAPTKKWKHHPVPLLMILSSAEGAMRIGALSHGIEEFSRDFEKIAPYSLTYFASASEPDKVTKKVKEFYFPGKTEITMEDYVNITHMFSDSWFNHGIIKGSNEHQGDTYFLYFDYIIKSPFMDEKYVVGANHCSDLTFIWELDYAGLPMPELNEKEVALSEDMVRMVYDFMETGIPTIPQSNKKWKKWTSKENNYVKIDDKGSHLKKGLLRERFNFWDNLQHRDKFDKQKVDRDEL